MKIDGACYCGATTFKADVDPKNVIICHCTDCQTMPGTTFRHIVPASAKGFRVVAGESKTYVKTAESENRRVMAFCATCGTQLRASDEGDDPGRIRIRGGTVHQCEQLTPEAPPLVPLRAQPWLSDIAALRRAERQPG